MHEEPRMPLNIDAGSTSIKYGFPSRAAVIHAAAQPHTQQEFTEMVKKYLAAFTAVIALSTAAFGAMAQQGVSNAKIDADVKKATGTLDDIQKLGKKIEARHNQDVASARRSTVRQAANRAVNTTRRAANTARKAANAAKNTAGKKAAGKNAAGKKKTSK